MKNLKVTLTKKVQIQTQKGLEWRFCSVVMHGSRIKPNAVLVNGQEEIHGEGVYYLDWYEGKTRRRLAVGKDAQEALNSKTLKEAELTAVSKGVEVTSAVGVKDERLTLRDAVQRFIEEIKTTKKPKTYQAYKLATEYFVESCSKIYLDQITRADLLNFAAFLRNKKELSPRTVYNKFETVVGFLKHFGIKGLVQTKDWPVYTEDPTEVYEREEVDRFLAACDETEKVTFSFLLQTGLREQELIYMEWADLNLERGLVTVRYKPQYGWQPKAYRGRDIPIRPELVRLLKDYKAEYLKKHETLGLLFPTSTGNPKLDFLDTVKRIAKGAGLNCQACEGCRSEQGWCSKWFLHKYRATFGTWNLWAGVDIYTVKTYMGHKDIASTMAYLKPNPTAIKQMSATFAGVGGD
jgi:integrase/recombinase XerD